MKATSCCARAAWANYKAIEFVEKCIALNCSSLTHFSICNVSLFECVIAFTQ